MLNKVELKYLNRDVENLQATLQKEVDEYLKNKDNSLEDRWEVWTKYSQTNSGDWIYHWDSTFDEEESQWSFDDYINDGNSYERGSIISYSSILNSYEYYLESAGEEAEEEPTEEYFDSRMNQMKEYLMEQNLRSYKFEW